MFYQKTFVFTRPRIFSLGDSVETERGSPADRARSKPEPGSQEMVGRETDEEKVQVMQQSVMLMMMHTSNTFMPQFNGK